jgi:hypothetical protein
VNRRLCNSSRRQCVLRAPVRALAAVLRGAAQSRLRGLVRFALRLVCPAAGAAASKRSCVVVRSRVVAAALRKRCCAGGAACERMHLPVMRRLCGLASGGAISQRANAACIRERRFGLRAVRVQASKMQPCAASDLTPPSSGRQKGCAFLPPLMSNVMRLQRSGACPTLGLSVACANKAQCCERCA